jgi:hypothetical protein
MHNTIINSNTAAYDREGFKRDITLFKAVFAIALFVCLTPGILLTIPSGASKLLVAFTHGVIFVGVYYLIYKLVSNFFRAKYQT